MTSSTPITTQRRMERGRLVYYRQAADPDYWDAHWENPETDQLYAWAAQGIAGPPVLQALYRERLPPGERILEAGCGIGQVVLALRVMGYDVEGVEWAPRTVEKVHARFPDLPVRVGDVTQLDVPDATYGAYLSLGVVEHRRDGPEPYLTEAFRVLKPGGVALISVPYLHPLRALKGRLGLYRGQPQGLDFYQYAFPRRKFAACVRRAGFEVMAFVPYDGFKGIKDEIPLVNRMFTLRWRHTGSRLEHWLRTSVWAEAHFGHMIMAVARKPANGHLDLVNQI